MVQSVRQQHSQYNEYATHGIPVIVQLLGYIVWNIIDQGIISYCQCGTCYWVANATGYAGHDHGF